MRNVMSTISLVQRYSPCICWIRELEVFFPDDNSQHKDELDAIIRCLMSSKSPASLSPTADNNHQQQQQQPILFVFTLPPLFNTSEVPERLAKSVHWQFRLEEGDDRLEPQERLEYTNWTLRQSPLDCTQADLASKLVDATKGYSLLELNGLFSDAECIALSQQSPPFCRTSLPPICMGHFELALRRRAPATGTHSRVGMADVGGQEGAKQLLAEALCELMKEHNSSKDRNELSNRMRRRTGILLHGPPGCGKTMLAKAVANQFGLSFVSVKGPELLSQFVGESERNLREVFARAKRSAPAVLFFDELDSLAPARGVNNDSGAVMDRMVSQLLTEMDACQWSKRRAVFIMGATNRPDLLDPCLLTPGRFDKLVPINPATGLSSKEQILCSICKNIKFEDGFSVRDLAMKCPETMSGAELAGLIRSASMHRLREMVEAAENGGDNKMTLASVTEFVIAERHFERALLELETPISSTSDEIEQ